MTQVPEPARRPRVVAVVGGPCSGKTTFLAWLMATHGELGVVLSEAATAILTEYRDRMPDRWFEDAATATHFQRLVVARQLWDLDLGISEATRRGISTVLCDRGALDGKAYGGNHPDRLVNIPLEELSGLYDRVIFFAPPPRSVWDREAGNNPTRRETYDEMVALSARLRACWDQHPGFVEVDGETWELKRASALSILLQRAA